MNFNRPLILASNSPRRQFLLHETGFEFSVQPSHADESFSDSMPVQFVPSFLAEKKAKSLEPDPDSAIVIASDTVVILNGEIINKPQSRDEAISMLNRLSGRTHQVITAVCLLSNEKIETFDDRTFVTFRPISKEQIEFYVDNFKPFDKAGAYGAQECLPPGMNPCSGDEIEFLLSVNKLDIIAKSMNLTGNAIGIAAIDKIQGSYFTVMGLPIHKVYSRLHSF